MEELNSSYNEAISLLKKLIITPSLSGEEENVAKHIRDFLTMKGIKYETHKHNTWAFNQHYDDAKPTILLNSHIDTVPPNSGYTIDPYQAIEKDGKLYGLGSNDAGASVVSLLAVFVHFFNQKEMNYNFLVAITAEEENSGKNGITSIIDLLPLIDFAIVGEPTQMKMAVAEKGLMVLDCKAIGESGHAARNEGINAIEIALKDINWFHSYQYEKKSKWLGKIKMTTTVIHAGKLHNVVPNECSFTVDIRTTDAYTNKEVLNLITKNVRSETTARSTRLSPSFIEENHPFVLAGDELNLPKYGSPTISDQALLSCPSIKIGPGDSARSHSANEYIVSDEIKSGIDTYIKILNRIL